MSAAPRHEITRNDILPMDVYAAERKERRKRMAEYKRPRRIAVGPYATFYFENYETMFQQIHEMLLIEKGGEEQIEDELSAYNPLIPKGNELVTTLMFEIEDPVRRNKFLYTIPEIEEKTYIEIDGDRVMADPEHDIDRTSEDGKSSSVHFLHFRLTPDQVAKFKKPDAKIVIGFEHANYGHQATMSPETRAALQGDLD